jgi:hypothetical protein
VVNDFEAVALLPSNNQLIIASNATSANKANNLPELIAWGRLFLRRRGDPQWGKPFLFDR